MKKVLKVKVKVERERERERRPPQFTAVDEARTRQERESRPDIMYTTLYEFSSSDFRPFQTNLQAGWRALVKLYESD